MNEQYFTNKTLEGASTQLLLERIRLLEKEITKLKEARTSTFSIPKSWIKEDFLSLEEEE